MVWSITEPGFGFSNVLLFWIGKRILYEIFRMNNKNKCFEQNTYLRYLHENRLLRQGYNVNFFYQNIHEMQLQVNFIKPDKLPWNTFTLVSKFCNQRILIKSHYQSAFICSKLAIETLKKVWNMFKMKRHQNDAIHQ